MKPFLLILAVVLHFHQNSAGTTTISPAKPNGKRQISIGGLGDDISLGGGFQSTTLSPLSGSFGNLFQNGGQQLNLGEYANGAGLSFNNFPTSTISPLSLGEQQQITIGQYGNGGGLSFNGLLNGNNGAFLNGNSINLGTLGIQNLQSQGGNVGLGNTGIGSLGIGNIQSNTGLGSLGVSNLQQLGGGGFISNSGVSGVGLSTVAPNLAIDPISQVDDRAFVTSGEPIIQKHIYVHVAPDEPEEIQPRKPIVLPPPQRHYKIIFVKAPVPPKPTSATIPLPQQIEEKTLVYVLVKKPEEAPQIKVAPPPATEPTKPEVFFIKYKTQQDAEAVISAANAAANNGGPLNGAALQNVISAAGNGGGVPGNVINGGNSLGVINVADLPGNGLNGNIDVRLLQNGIGNGHLETSIPNNININNVQSGGLNDAALHVSLNGDNGLIGSSTIAPLTLSSSYGPPILKKRGAKRGAKRGVKKEQE